MDCARGVLFLPARFFCCLKQDGQDGQDLQDGGLGMRRKGLEDLNVYRNQQEREAKVREDLNMQRRLRRMRGTGPRATGTEARFFCSAGVCPPRSLPHPVNPDNPGHPASDARAIKVRWTFSPCCAYVL